jgi:nitroreductase
MEFQQLLLSRQSVRKYLDQPVEAQKLEQLIDAVRLAPSACNAQPWTLILVDEPELKNKVARATCSKAFGLNSFAIQAPVIAVLVLEQPPWTVRMGALIQRREFPLIDIGIAAAQFCLRATDLGLATCMMGWFDEAAVHPRSAPHRADHQPRLRPTGLPPAAQIPQGTSRHESLQQVLSPLFLGGTGLPFIDGVAKSHSRSDFCREFSL